jgi:hypothetical protein
LAIKQYDDTQRRLKILHAENGELKTQVEHERAMRLATERDLHHLKDEIVSLQVRLSLSLPLASHLPCFPLFALLSRLFYLVSLCLLLSSVGNSSQSELCERNDQESYRYSPPLILLFCLLPSFTSSALVLFLLLIPLPLPFRLCRSSPYPDNEFVSFLTKLGNPNQ